VAAGLFQDAQPLRTWLGASKADDAQSAQNWLEEAQVALASGRGRTAVRYVRRAEDTARLDAGRGEDATVIPFEGLRHRVDEIDTSAGPSATCWTTRPAKLRMAPTKWWSSCSRRPGTGAPSDPHATAPYEGVERPQRRQPRE
jgi:hypothetical protein